MGSGLILLVIVGAWLAVLVPMGLRAHDTASSNRSAERFSDAMRVLSRRTGTRSPAGPSSGQPDPADLTVDEPEPGDLLPRRSVREVLGALRTAGRTAGHTAGHTAGRTAGTRAGSRLSGLAHRARHRDRDEAGSSVRPARPVRTAAAQRRRVLGVLLAVTLLLAVAGLAGPRLLLGVAALGVVVTALFVLRCRQLTRFAQQRREDAWLRAEALRRSEETVAVRVVGGSVPAPVAVPQQQRVEAPEPVAATNVRVQRARPAASAEWQPVPVPLPTYVTKPAAPGRPAAPAVPAARAARPVDTTPLDDPGRRVEAPAERRRAVGDW